MLLYASFSILKLCLHYNFSHSIWILYRWFVARSLLTSVLEDPASWDHLDKLFLPQQGIDTLDGARSMLQGPSVVKPSFTLDLCVCYKLVTLIKKPRWSTDALSGHISSISATGAQKHTSQRSMSILVHGRWIHSLVSCWSSQHAWQHIWCCSSSSFSTSQKNTMKK